MLGAIIGDMAGTRYEYSEFIDSKQDIVNYERRKSILKSEVKLIDENSFYSDDTILTVAMIDAIINKKNYGDTLKEYCLKYSNLFENKKDFFKTAFSPNFINWAQSTEIINGKSIGNGAAMRVSPFAFLFEDFDEMKKEVIESSKTSHDTKDAINGALSIATSIFLAKKGYSKYDIKKYVMSNYGYNLDYDLQYLQKHNKFSSLANVTVSEAIYIFLISNNFEDALRKALSIGGDTDTIASMACSISEAYYGIPFYLKEKAILLLNKEFKDIIIEAYKKMQGSF